MTGGGRGIGRHLADRLCASGARVGIFELDAGVCAKIASEGSFSAWHCDVSDPVKVDEAIQAAADAGFEPDVLVNNAGIIHSEPLVNLLQRENRVHSRESWRRVMAADLDSVFYVTSRIVDRMISRRCRGVVVSISSISANGNPGQSAYAAAKAGVNALTHTWAKELGPLGLRFAAIAPGFLDTPSTRSALSETVLERVRQQVPLKKLGDVEHIFQAVRFVIENDYVNGTVLEIDGGLVI